MEYNLAIEIIAACDLEKAAGNKQPSLHSWPRVHKTFRTQIQIQKQIQDQDQAQVKNSFTTDFLWNLLYLFNYWLFVFDKLCTPHKISRNYKLFYNCDRYEILSALKTESTLSQLIVSSMYFNNMHLRSKTTFTSSMNTQIKFSWTFNGK